MGGCTALSQSFVVCTSLVIAFPAGGRLRCCSTLASYTVTVSMFMCIHLLICGHAFIYRAFICSFMCVAVPGGRLRCCAEWGGSTRTFPHWWMNGPPACSGACCISYYATLKDVPKAEMGAGACCMCGSHSVGKHQSRCPKQRCLPFEMFTYNPCMRCAG